MRDARLNHYLAAVEGIAISRHWLAGDRAEAEARFSSLRQLVEQDSSEAGLCFAAPCLTAADGYERWAATYDAFANPLILIEQGPIRSLIDEVAPGRALDAACGSGRHTAYLVERGHDVIGVDASPAMLAKAAATAGGADLRAGSLDCLPLESASMDLVVCALALTHCEELQTPIAELARVLRPGGRLLLSDFHPFLGILGNTALFLDAQGKPAFVASSVHLHAAYIDAFQKAGLKIERCIEPAYGDAELPALQAPFPRNAHDAIATSMRGLPGALIWSLERH